MKYIVCILLFLLNVPVTIAQSDYSVMPFLRHGAEQAEIGCSLLDSEGFWWYGGKGTGLCRFDGYETEVFRSDRDHPDLLRSNDLLCIIEQKNNAEIWFGTKEGAYILRKKDYKVVPLNLPMTEEGQKINELADKRITCLLAAADGSVWLSFRNQLLHFSAKAKLIERFETQWEGKNRSVMRLSFDRDSTLWAGLWNGGVLRWKKENGAWKQDKREWSEFPAEPLPMMTDAQTTMMLDSVMRDHPAGNDTTVLSWAKISTPQCEGYFIGTYHSLYLYQEGLSLPPAPPEGKGVKSSRDNGGLTLLQGDLDKVRSMAYSSKRQTLYLLSKARGVCKWKDNKLTTLLDSTGFRQLQLQGDTALLLSKGVGSVRLFNLRSHLLTIDNTTADVRPVVTAYTVDGKKHIVSFGQTTLELTKDNELLEISLSTLDYENAAQIQFAYRLDDDGEWTVLPEGEHIAKFSHLPSGESMLQVRATDAYGRWSAPTTVLTIVRSAAWYEHVWLWIIMVVVVAIGFKIQVSRFRSLRSLRRQGFSGALPAASASRTITRVQDAEEQNSPHPDGNSSLITLNSSLKGGFPIADQEFLDKAAAAVDANITNTEYSVDALAGDLCMSRANLHRKMRAITGKTPTDFIRNQRLERAAHLLRTTSHSVNEIADLVGFSYASYFTKCFKEKYGVLPKDF